MLLALFLIFPAIKAEIPTDGKIEVSCRLDLEDGPAGGQPATDRADSAEGARAFNGVDEYLDFMLPDAVEDKDFGLSLWVKGEHQPPIVRSSPSMRIIVWPSFSIPSTASTWLWQDWRGETASGE